MSAQKTNAMRILERSGIKYSTHEYPHKEDAVDALTVAKLTGQDPAKIFKTLVTKGTSGNYNVFVIPAEKELDMKKAAAAAGEKSVEMIPVKEINKVTGYIRGGCSPIGMKKKYKTVFAEEALAQETIYVSGGKIGCQIEASPQELIKASEGITAEITRKDLK